VAPNGLAIPESDPLHRDLYVDVVELRGAPHLGPRAVAHLRTEFAAMPVENPDGERGIRLHVDGPRRVDVSVRDLHDRTDYETTAVTQRHLRGVLYTPERMGDRHGVSHLVVILPPETDLLNAGRGFASWKIAAITHPTTRVVIHELLHTVVALDAFPATCDGRAHTCRGYLSYSDDTHFSPATVAWLANNSYANNAATVGDERYGAPASVSRHAGRRLLAGPTGQEVEVVVEVEGERRGRGEVDPEEVVLGPAFLARAGHRVGPRVARFVDAGVVEPAYVPPAGAPGPDVRGEVTRRAERRQSALLDGLAVDRRPRAFARFDGAFRDLETVVFRALEHEQFRPVARDVRADLFDVRHTGCRHTESM
jgi:hypothetical protein